jgi:hypothetical protein
MFQVKPRPQTSNALWGLGQFAQPSRSLSLQSRHSQDHEPFSSCCVFQDQDLDADEIELRACIAIIWTDLEAVRGQRSKGQIKDSRSSAANLPMKQETMETEMADSPQRKNQKFLIDDDVEEGYEYKNVNYKDFITKPKYIRSFPTCPWLRVALTDSAWWILAVVVGVLTVLFAVNHDKIVTVGSHSSVNR